MMLIHFICISFLSLFYQHSMALKAAKEKKKKTKEIGKKATQYNNLLKKSKRFIWNP